MSGGGSTVTRTELDPNVAPYVTYGLSEAQKLYQAGPPSYYPNQTYAGIQTSTENALAAAERRATAGSPLLTDAQKQARDTISGSYLSGNPFFEGAFQPAAKAAQTSFLDAIQQVGSQASRAGRYGSGAMGQLQDRASGQFAQTLADTAGKLAYENYAQERGRQQAMIGAAPSLAEADYADINRLQQAGQAREAYRQQQIDADIAKYNFMQNRNAAQLQQYLSAAYGSPMGGVQISPTYRNPLAGGIGGAALGQALGYNPAIGAAIGSLLG